MQTKTLDELLQEYEPERLAEIARSETPEAVARSSQKRAEEIQREIRQGIRNADGDWIEQPPSDEDEDEDEDPEDDQ